METQDERKWAGSPSLVDLLVPIASLKPDDDNAMTHTEKDIDITKASYAAHGQQKPLVVWRKTKKQRFKVMAGNGGLEAMKLLDWDHCAVSEYVGTEIQARAFALADNKTSNHQRFDTLKVGEHLQMIADAGLSFDTTGFLDREAKQIFEQLGYDPDKPGGAVANELSFNILIVCDDEDHQAVLLTKLQEEGLSCRALML